MIVQTEKTGKGREAAHASSVDDTANVELHDADSKPDDDTTEHNHQDLNEHEESRHDAGSNLSFDEISNDNPEDELQPWINYIAREKESNAQSGWFVSSKRIHVVDPQAEPDSLEAGKDDCRTPRKLLDQACLQLEPSSINQAKKGIGNKEDRPRDGKTTS